MNDASALIKDLYKGFDPIDTDTPGGYARVCQVTTEEELSVLRAFKVMRSNLDWEVGFPRFQEEIRILAQIFSQNQLPEFVSQTVTRLYDYGFVASELSEAIDKYRNPDDKVRVIQTKNLTKFVEVGQRLEKDNPNRWKPYLVVDLAGYDDSLFRQISRRPATDPEGLYRLPSGEVVYLAIRLLDTIDYLHTHLKRVYLDWKPEHVHWNGKTRCIKLIDWNVTCPIDDWPGSEQNIKDDIRLLCASVLYSCLTMVDLEGKMIGPKPTTLEGRSNPTQEIRKRYWTDDPVFYEANRSLDERIKAILRRGINPHQGYSSARELKQDLLNYARGELGLNFDDEAAISGQGEAYWKAIEEIRAAQDNLFRAYSHLSDAILEKGTVSEFTRLSRVINKAFENFPMP